MNGAPSEMELAATPSQTPAADLRLRSPAAAGCNCGGADCPTCGPRLSTGTRADVRGYIYALGRIEARFPNLSVEKEFAQATARAETAGLSDRTLLQTVLSNPENAYLARQLCWTFSIEGVDSYLLLPRDAADVRTLVEALRPTPRLTDIDVVVGTVGPPLPAGACAGLQLPTVSWAQIYSFDVDSFVSSLPRPEGLNAKQFAASAEEILERVMQLADNGGLTDDQRALNYLVLRYPAICQAVAERHAANRSFTGVETRASPLGGARRIVEVIFSFRDRRTDVVEKLFVRVDVNELFPFLVSKLAPYYDR